MVTDFPSAYSPPVVLTDHPTLAEIDNKNLGGSSLVQENTISKENRSSFFITLNIT